MFKFAKKSKEKGQASESSDETATPKKGEDTPTEMDTPEVAEVKDKKIDFPSKLRKKKKGITSSNSNSQLSSVQPEKPQEDKEAPPTPEVSEPVQKEEKEEKPEAESVSFLTPLWNITARIGSRSKKRAKVEAQTEKLKSEEGSSSSSTVVEGSQSDAEDEQQETETLKSEEPGGSVLEEEGRKKPGSRLGVLSIDDIDQKLQAEPSTSSSNAELEQLQLLIQSCTNKETDPVTAQLKRVRMARQRRRASQSYIHPPGRRRSMSDIFSSTDVIDFVGSFSNSGNRKNKEQEEMAERFDDFCMSSDTDSDYFPCVDYEKAHQIIDMLRSESSDTISMQKLQVIFADYQRYFEKAKNNHDLLRSKVTDLKMERMELMNSKKEGEDTEFDLITHQAALQSENENLRFQLKQERENCCTSAILHKNTKDKLRVKEEQHRLEEQAKKQVMTELTAARKKEQQQLQENESLQDQINSLEAKAASGRLRQEEAEREVALCQVLRENLQRERKERQYLKDETCSQFETICSLSLRLDKAEAHANNMASEIRQVESQLAERNLQLDTLQQDKDQIHSRLRLRLGDLEKENKDMITEIEINKKKARKFEEQRNAIETQMELKMKKHLEAKEEINRSLKTTARKLEKEVFLRGQLMKANKKLQDQVESLMSLRHNNEELHISKRQLEQEVLNLKHQIDAYH